MCGITGIARGSRFGPAPRVLQPQLLRHRGPDDEGEWWSPDGQVGLAHRRLSIVDLSPGGHQPMLSDDATLAIVYNGEIYNHRELREELAARGHAFRSHSDTEVLLAAYREWGVDFLPRLNGMFAFALYDARRARLVLARDRAGEKPLFLRLADGELRFASELKALLADAALPRDIDPEALDCYLASGYAPGEMCLLEGYRKLPPAHVLLFDLERGEATITRWWSAPPLDPRADGADDAALLEQLEALLGDAVGRQLVADVPVGVLLSGGVDSSLVTALAARASSRVRTFTVGFEGFGSHDESGHARLIASHFGTEHTELQAGSVGPEILRELAHQYDEPIIDSSMLPTYLVSRLVRSHCTVALGGDGGDELFGGYPHHARLERMRRAIGWIPQPLRRAVAALGARATPVGFKGRNWLLAAGSDLQREVPLVGGHFDPAARRALLPRLGAVSMPAERRLAARTARGPMDLVQRATRFDFDNYLPEDILVKVDRASMLASLELRAPLLDHRVLEFAFGKVPSRLKADATERKVLLKQLAAKLLPSEFDRQRKQGFSVPLGAWLRQGAWLQFFREVLLDPGCTFRRDAVEALFRQQQRGGGNHERLFGLVLFELWRRQYRCAL
jgi:asparagine synthase (glutamine-hydrolysing)